MGALIHFTYQSTLDLVYVYRLQISVILCFVLFGNLIKAAKAVKCANICYWPASILYMYCMFVYMHVYIYMPCTYMYIQG